MPFVTDWRAKKLNKNRKMVKADGFLTAGLEEEILAWSIFRSYENSGFMEYYRYFSYRYDHAGMYIFFIRPCSVRNEQVM